MDPALVSIRECFEWTPGHSWKPCSSFAASLCGVHLRMLDGPYPAVRCRGIRTSSVSSCRQAKFSDLSFYLADNCRTQGTPLGICNGMPRALIAIAKLLRMRRIPFLGLTGTARRA